MHKKVIDTRKTIFQVFQVKTKVNVCPGFPRKRLLSDYFSGFTGWVFTLLKSNRYSEKKVKKSTHCVGISCYWFGNFLAHLRFMLKFEWNTRFYWMTVHHVKRQQTFRGEGKKSTHFVGISCYWFGNFLADLHYTLKFSWNFVLGTF